MARLRSQTDLLTVGKGTIITNSSFINGPSVKEFKADLEQYLNVIAPPKCIRSSFV